MIKEEILFASVKALQRLRIPLISWLPSFFNSRDDSICGLYLLMYVMSEGIKHLHLALFLRTGLILCCLIGMSWLGGLKMGWGCLRATGGEVREFMGEGETILNLWIVTGWIKIYYYCKEIIPWNKFAFLKNPLKLILAQRLKDHFL